MILSLSLRGMECHKTTKSNFSFSASQGERKQGYCRFGTISPSAGYAEENCSQNRRFLNLVHVPEDPLAILIEGSRRYDAGDICARYPNAVIPAACRFRVCPDTRDITNGISRLLLNAQSLSASRTCSVSLPSAIDKSTTDRLL